MLDVQYLPLLNTDSYLLILNIEESVNLLSLVNNYSDIMKDFNNVFTPKLRYKKIWALKKTPKHFFIIF